MSYCLIITDEDSGKTLEISGVMRIELFDGREIHSHASGINKILTAAADCISQRFSKTISSFVRKPPPRLGLSMSDFVIISTSSWP